MRLSKARKECVNAMMKDTIFQAASSVVEKHGVSGLTMDRVATTVGVATGSLYNYFHDKDELLKFFYARLVDPCFQAIEEAAASDLPAPQKLEKILRTAWDHSIKHKGLIQLLAGVNQGDKIKRDLRPRLLGILTAIFKQGIQEGTFRSHNFDLTGHMLLGCLSELFEMQVDGASKKEIDEYVGILIEATSNGFSINVENHKHK